jgi:hypothetical protein
MIKRLLLSLGFVVVPAGLYLGTVALLNLSDDWGRPSDPWIMAVPISVVGVAIAVGVGCGVTIWWDWVRRG